MANGPESLPLTYARYPPQRALTRVLRGLGRRLPYPVGARLLAAAWNPPLSRAWPDLARERYDLGLMAPYTSPGVDPDDALARRLFNERARDWREHAFAARPWREVAPLVRVTGLAALRERRADRRPVVLISSHLGAGRVAPSVLCRHGLAMRSLEESDRLRALGGAGVAGLDVVSLSDTFIPKALAMAMATLRDGGVVHLVGDGLWGAGATTVDFLGRPRELRGGFARLAVRTNALAVPIMAPVDRHGCVHVEVLDPLPTSPPDAPEADRVAALVRAYARLLEQRWRDDPGNIARRHLYRALAGEAYTAGVGKRGSL